MEHSLTSFRAESPPADGGDAAGADGRTEPRVALFIRAAKLVTAAGEFLCVIRDVSSGGVALRLFHEIPQGERCKLELQNGDRYDVALVWKVGERAGFRFEDRADVERIIASPGRHPKRPLRLRLDAPAQLVAGLRRLDVRLRDLSQAGAKIDVAHKLAVDQNVRICAPGLRPLKARVRWHQGAAAGGAEAGLLFEEPFGFEELALIAFDLQQQR